MSFARFGLARLEISRPSLRPARPSGSKAGSGIASVRSRSENNAWTDQRSRSYQESPGWAGCSLRPRGTGSCASRFFRTLPVPLILLPLPWRERGGVRGPSGVRNAVLRRAISQLRAYAGRRRRAFTCPLDFRAMQGSPFQRKVWKALLAIPFGQTRTYGEVARAVGRPGAARAVGSACGRNPVAIVVPCHRVIGSNGRLAGYSAGLTVKRRLLQLEGGQR